MEILNVWHLFRLHWQKIVCFLFLAAPAFAQSRVQYQADYDNRPTHYGFFFGAGPKTYDVRLNPVALVYPDNIYTSITSLSDPQIRIGGQINSRLSDDFDLRLLPGIAVTTQRRFAIFSARKTPALNDSTIDKQEGKAWLEIPLHLKFKSQRRGNARMYGFGGFRYGFETNSLDRIFRTPNSSLIQTRRTDFCVEYGFGADLFLRYFKFSPELLFSHGIANSAKPISAQSPPLPNNIISKLQSHSITLQFIFN